MGIITERALGSLCGQAVAKDHRTDQALVEAVPLRRCDPPIAVQRLGDLSRTIALTAESPDLGEKLFVSAESGQLGDGTEHAGVRFVATCPVHGDIRVFTFRVDRDDDSIDQETQHLLAIRIRCRGLRPQRWEIRRQASDRLSLTLGETPRLLTFSSTVLLLKTTLGLELLFPRLLEVSHHQAILGFNCLVLALRTLCLIASSLEALLPERLGLLPFLFDLLTYAEAQLQRRGLEGGQRQLRDHLVETTRREAGANGFAAHNRSMSTHVSSVGTPLT